MSSFSSLTDKVFKSVLSSKTRERSEAVIIYIAIAAFLFHLLLIFLNDFNIVDFNDKSELLVNPISALYTPFTFILLYEVYLLVYYLPKSITDYIRKQYEIITLIIIRRSFKDMSHLELSSNWMQIEEDLYFTYDVVATTILFLFIFWFYRMSAKSSKQIELEQNLDSGIRRFIILKKWLAILLVPTLLILAIVSVVNWSLMHVFSLKEVVSSIKDVNNVFFDEFFTILIMVDVLLLLISFNHTDRFYKVIRNSGFVISTVLIKLSFGAKGLVSTILVVGAVGFGTLILFIHNRYEKYDLKNKLGIDEKGPGESEGED